MKTLLQRTKARLLEVEQLAKKSLGQNFLINESRVRDIVKATEDFQPQLIAEVGPGLGSLTESLSELSVERLVLIELDKGFAKYWRNRSFEVIEADALAWDWRELGSISPKILTSNLPYQISSSIVIERSVDDQPLDGMVLMFQREVADRIRSACSQKSYGLLSVIAQNFWEIKVVCNCPARDFYPAPQISSRVLSFRPKPWGQGKKRNFLKFVKNGFSQRRKFLAKNLNRAYLSHEGFDHRLAQAFEARGLSPKCRAEELTPLEWSELFHSLF